MEFQPGNYVYLKIRSHRQTSMPTKLHPKLSTSYCGPYKILKIGVVAYKLQLLAEARIHLIFLISQIKKALGNHTVEASLLLTELQTSQEHYQPMQVLNRRVITQDRTAIP